MKRIFYLLLILVSCQPDPVDRATGTDFPYPVRANGGLAITAPLSFGGVTITATGAEINFLSGVTSNVQTQLNGKAATSHTHTGTYLPVTGAGDIYTHNASEFSLTSHNQAQSTITGLVNNLSSLYKDTTGIFNVLGYGAIGDSTTLEQTACQNAIDAAEAAGGGTVIFPKGVYRVNYLVVNGDVNLIGYGAKLVGTASTANHYIIELTGALTATSTTLSGNAALADDHLDVTSESGFTAGDYIVIRDNTYAYSTTGRNQEFDRVLSVAANLINLHRPLISAYTTAQTATVYKYSPVKNVKIEGLSFENIVGAYGGGIKLDYCYNVRVLNCAFTKAYSHSCYLMRSTEITIENNSAARDGQSLASSNGYGIGTGESSHHCLITDNYTENVRENFCTDNSRFIRVTNNIFKNSYDSGINSHGSGNSFIDIIGNTIEGGCSTAGIYVRAALAIDHDITISDNRVVNVQCDGISAVGVSGSVIYQINIRDNDVRNYGLIIAGSDYGISTSYIQDSRVSGNTITGDGGNGPDYGIYLITPNTNVEVINNSINNIPNGYGIGYYTCTDIILSGNVISDVSSYNFRSVGTSTGVLIKNNWTDDLNNTFLGTEVILDNYMGGYFVYSYAITATADGLTTGLISAGPKEILVTSADANHICCLPTTGAATVGQIITGRVGANGFELRPIAAQAATVYINGVTTNVEAAIPASSSFEIKCIDATHWILKAWTALGAELTAIIPDAI